MKLHGFDDVVTCGAESFLPRARWRIFFYWRIFRDLRIAARNRSWRDAKYFFAGSSMRCANFKSYQWMGIYVERPMPWLLGPAKQSYPHLFK